MWPSFANIPIFKHSISIKYVIGCLFSDPLPAKQPKRRISNAEELLFDLLAEKDGKVTMSKFWAVSYADFSNANDNIEYQFYFTIYTMPDFSGLFEDFFS